MSERKVYDLVYREADGEQWWECPICGRLDGAVLKGHGPAHVVEDASQ